MKPISILLSDASYQIPDARLGVVCRTRQLLIDNSGHMTACFDPTAASARRPTPNITVPANKTSRPTRPFRVLMVVGLILALFTACTGANSFDSCRELPHLTSLRNGTTQKVCGATFLAPHISCALVRPALRGLGKGCSCALGGKAHPAA